VPIAWALAVASQPSLVSGSTQSAVILWIAGDGPEKGGPAQFGVMMFSPRFANLARSLPQIRAP
jgi:hypothetical protein